MWTAVAVAPSSADDAVRQVFVMSCKKMEAEMEVKTRIGAELSRCEQKKAVPILKVGIVQPSSHSLLLLSE